MRILVRKMERLGLLKVQIVLGTLVMAASIVGLPLAMFIKAPELMTNPYILGVLGIGMLFFAFVAYVCFVRPYILYRKFPEIQAETDGQYLYIHAKKEAMIPLADISEANVRVELPFLYRKEFISEFIIHLFSEDYGNLVLDIPGYGSYRMRFVANVKDVARELHSFLYVIVNKH